MKGLLFFGMLLGIAFIAWYASKEGFQDMPNPELSIPLISPRYQTLTTGAVKPFTEPSTALLAPPPGQTASINALPSEDPALQKASAQRIQSVYESLKGFFINEAPGLQKMGEPSIQLPLTTAVSDRGRLQDELNVLKRNPGLESNLTTEDVNGVEANLGYLQKKWRLSVNAQSGGPMLPEGFTDGVKGSVYGWFRSFFGGDEEGFQVTTGGTNTGGTNTGTGGSGSGSLTLDDLQGLSLKLNIEIIRLTASGATDTNTQSRITVLTAIKQKVDDLLLEVKNGRKLNTIPLTKADIADFLPAISNKNSKIPDILKDWGLTSVLSSLFPNYATGDLDGSDVAKKLFETYMKDITHNLSWGVELNYKGQAEQDIAANYASAMNDARYAVDSTGTPVAANATGATIAKAATAGAAGESSAYRGVFESVIKSVTGHDAKVTVGSSTHSTKAHGSGPAPPFDWQERSREICTQITARGMNAYDFGCMKNTKVHDGFSWRGYTRMICTRLGTVYDPSIPELCGCPPPSWPGWRP